jgi:hypothetical protein
MRGQLKLGRAAQLRFGLPLLLVMACSGPDAHRRLESRPNPGATSLTQDGFDMKAPFPQAREVADLEIQTAGYGADPKPVSAAATPVEPARGRTPVLIYTANLTMAVFEVQPGLEAVESAARELGGFLAKQSNNTIVVRVPAARFHEALGRLEKLGDVTNRHIEAQDVTQEYLDLELRIKSARSVRERLEQLLSRAVKVEDSIAIEKELERVMSEIERMEGRLKYLRDQAQYSTITVRFDSRAKELVAKDTFKLPFPWLEQLGLGRLLELQ